MLFHKRAVVILVLLLFCIWLTLRITETADQILSHVIPVCQWNPQISLNPSSTVSVYPLFPDDVREWIQFFRDAEDHFNNNVLFPVDTILKTQGAIFHCKCPGLLDVPDFVLGTNDFTVAKISAEMKTQFNLNLCVILSQMFDAMACNGLHYGILSNYSDTYFLKQEETNQTTLYISRVVQPNEANLTLRKYVYYISQLAINNNAGERLDCIKSDNILSN
ncbi:11619_t:CDS:2, partial [Diversispora eburnea]